MNLVLRFLIGGLVVSAFSALGDLFEPKSFGGLFGAAPSVALATLTLTVHSDGRAFAATEARSMVAGSVCFLFYVLTCLHLLVRLRLDVFKAAVISFLSWFASAAAFCSVLIR